MNDSGTSRLLNPPVVDVLAGREFANLSYIFGPLARFAMARWDQICDAARESRDPGS